MTVPYIDRRLPTQYRGLLDSLRQVVGMPDSLLYEVPSQREATATERVMANYNPRTRAMRLSPDATMPRRRLVHEFGHLLQFTESPTFFEWFDPEMGGKTPRPADLERFADAFADVFEALSRRDTVAARHPRLNRLAEALAERGPFARDSLLQGVRKAPTESDSVPVPSPEDTTRRRLRRRGH